MFYRKLMFVVVVLCFTASAFGQLFNGNLLPGQNDGSGGANVLPKTMDQIQDTAAGTDVARQYVGNAGANGGPLSANAVLNCPPIGKIGDLVFQYGAYTGEFPGKPQNSAGGMLIRGGLKLAPNIQVKPNHTLRYVQVYRETGGEGRTTIDSFGDQPFYPNHTLNGFTPLFFDAPADNFDSEQVPTAIDFETALVCFDNNKPKDLFALGVFQWGYQIDKANKTILNENLLLPTSLTALLSDTFNAEFGANGTRDTGWTLTDGGCPDCFQVVPEPTTLLLFALGAAPALRLALRPQKRKASEVS